MDYEPSYNNYYNALLIALEIGDQIHLATIYNSLGGFYYNCENYTDAEVFWQKARQIHYDLENQEGIAKTENNIGEVFRLTGNYKMALPYFERAVAINKKLKFNTWLSTNYDNIGMIYHMMGDNEKSLSYLYKGLTLAKDIEFAKGECTSYSSLGLFYYENNKLDSALKYFWKSYLLATEIQEIRTLKAASEGLSKTHKCMSNFDSALMFQEKFKNYSDTILNGRNLTRLSLVMAQTQFENEKRIEEIRQKKSRNRYILVIITLVSVVIIISLIYYNQRNKFRYLDLKKQHLELEKKYLNNELTNFAMHITQKNELLNDLKNRIQSLRHSGADKQNTGLSGINSLIIQSLSHKDDIEVFQNNADKLNREFIVELKQKFPSLTTNEVQLCTLLKLNLSTKEIASIRQVTPRAVKMARYRLRKKLELPLEGDISEFLNKL